MQVKSTGPIGTDRTAQRYDWLLRFSAALTANSPERVQQQIDTALLIGDDPEVVALRLLPPLAPPSRHRRRTSDRP
jgi:hypothetical protein